MIIKKTVQTAVKLVNVPHLFGCLEAKYNQIKPAHIYILQQSINAAS